MLEIRMVLAWFQARTTLLREQDNDRGELLPWVIITALLVVGAIAVVAIIVNKAKDTATNIPTQ